MSDALERVRAWQTKRERPRRPRRHPPEVRARALELLREGKTLTRVARELGVSVPGVRTWAINAGVEYIKAQRSRATRANKDAALREKTIQLARAGLKNIEIARELDVPARKVDAWTRAAGMHHTRGGCGGFA